MPWHPQPKVLSSIQGKDIRIRVQMSQINIPSNQKGPFPHREPQPIRKNPQPLQAPLLETWSDHPCSFSKVPEGRPPTKDSKIELPLEAASSHPSPSFCPDPEPSPKEQGRIKFGGHWAHAPGQNPQGEPPNCSLSPAQLHDQTGQADLC